MPIRYITIPSPITFKNPLTGELILTNGQPESMTFEQFLLLLMQNPLWIENYRAMRAQSEVLSAWEKTRAVAGEPKVMPIAEEDWQRLKQAAEFPKPTLGYNPALSSQFLPMVAAIIEAPTTSPPMPVVALTPPGQ
jgi:hypothetical protein